MSRPPSRAPHYCDAETYGWSADLCACNLIDTLAAFAHMGVPFKGDANGRIWTAQNARTDAQLAFTSDAGEGVIELSVDDTGWVRADLYLGGAFVLRAWIEELFEEKEFWPDGSDGAIPPNGDPPGRISKRGRWLQIRCAAFPGVADKGNGFWDVEAAEYAH